jgi:diguanylate cyclase (GGDEF)-like protein
MISRDLDRRSANPRGGRRGSISLVGRTQLVLAIAFVLLFAIMGGVSNAILDRSFQSFEEQNAGAVLSRAVLLVNEQIRAVANSAKDYAQWDDTWNHLGQGRAGASVLGGDRMSPIAEGRAGASVLGGDRMSPIAEGRADYLPVNYTNRSLENNDIDLVALLDADGCVIFQGLLPGRLAADQPASSRHRDDGLVDAPSELLAPWTAPRFRQLKGAEDVTGGLSFIGDWPILAAVSPILKTDGSGPARGLLVMAKILDQTRLEELSTKCQAVLTFSRSPNGDEMIWTAPRIIRGKEALTVSRGWASLDGAGPIVLAAVAARPLASQIATGRLLLIVNLLVAAGAGLLLTGTLLKRIVLARITEFAARADRIRNVEGRTLRLPVEGGDELDRLAEAINELLDELQTSNEKLSHGTLHDPLTGLGNRALVTSRLQLAYQLLRRRPDRVFAVHLIDLDGFRRINEAFGHPAGDHLLREIAARIQALVETGDTVARLAADEFLVLEMEAENAENARERSERLIAAIRRPVTWEEQTLHVTASIGAVLTEPGAREDPDRLLRDADIAMRAAKAAGRDRAEIFVKGMRRSVAERLTLEEELRRAIETDSATFEVCFQPVLTASDLSPTSVEALTRWRHPERGLLAPDSFLASLEQAGLGAAFDRLVLRRALQSIRRLRESHPELAVCVNIAADRILEPGFISWIEEALAVAGLEPAALRLEITESAMARNEAAMIEPIRTLTERGVRFMLDDFGVGYSSLHRLHLLPIDFVKLDRTFSRRIEQGEHRILGAIVRLSHDLGKLVVAEGVETAKQEEILRGIGVDYLQGHLYARALSEEKLLEFLETRCKS